jgi:cyclin M-like protein
MAIQRHYAHHQAIRVKWSLSDGYDEICEPFSVVPLLQEMNALTTEILILVLLILLNGFFSLSEMAVVSARKVRPQQRVEDGSMGTRTTLALAVQPIRFLSTVQTGITLIGILSGATVAAVLAGHPRSAKIPAPKRYTNIVPARPPAIPAINPRMKIEYRITPSLIFFLQPIGWIVLRDRAIPSGSFAILHLA